MKLIFKTDDDVLVAEVEIKAEAMKGRTMNVWSAISKEIRRAIAVDAERLAKAKGGS